MYRLVSSHNVYWDSDFRAAAAAAQDKRAAPIGSTHKVKFMRKKHVQM